MIQADEAETVELEDFTYDLPPHLIAQAPLAVRHDSRLLSLTRKTQKVTHGLFSELPDLLKPTDLLVVNDTRVIPARLVTMRQSGGIIKLLLLKPDARRPSLWYALGSPLKRLRVGEKLELIGTGKTRTIIVADICTEGQKQLILDLGPPDQVFSILQEVGYAPLPPYIHRLEYSRAEMRDALERRGSSGEAGGWESETRAADLHRYQTVYARVPGAVAAPTAGLHFSQELLHRLKARGNKIVDITLHVGPGTFKPITGSIAEHTLESENFTIAPAAAEAINCAKENGHRVIAVGTTSCRALETAGDTGTIRAITNGATSLYIRPGYRFQIVDGLITNFHLSKSSLLVLVSAFAGRKAVLDAYHEAISKEYRFFSYGDAMLIL